MSVNMIDDQADKKNFRKADYQIAAVLSAYLFSAFFVQGFKWCLALVKEPGAKAECPEPGQGFRCGALPSHKLFCKCHAPPLGMLLTNAASQALNTYGAGAPFSREPLNTYLSADHSIFYSATRYFITLALPIIFLAFIPVLLSAQILDTSSKTFMVGSAMSVITPPIGTSINGGMQDRTVRNIHDETHARAIILDDGSSQLAIVVSDLCMVYRETLDAAKKRASKFTGIPESIMMMSATHTHTAGTACSVFQSDPDPAYLAFLSERIADAVIRAYENRVPARIGWGFGEETSQVHNRRWLLKPGMTAPNPFGGEDRVQMNPGVANDKKLKPSGPVDPQIPVISVKSLAGEHIALLANYSLHYVGGLGPGEISADYYGVFNRRMKEMLGATDQFVSIMSNGTSGNINNVDYSGKTQAAKGRYVQMNYVANVVAAEVYKVLQNMEYQDWVSLSSAQAEIQLGVRLPDAEDVTRAEKIVANAEGPNMKSREEIYARETLLLQDYPEEVDIPLQIFRIGNLGIAAIPCEVFVETGLELKEKSPVQPMFTISLANGYFGYLPTPEQHELGGYETWRARSSFLEVDASEKIIEMILNLLKELN